VQCTAVHCPASDQDDQDSFEVFECFESTDSVTVDIFISFASYSTSRLDSALSSSL